MPKVKFIDYMNLKKKEYKSVALLREGNKILLGENTERKIGAQTKGKSSIECLTWASIPNTLTKHRHQCKYQEVHADMSLI